MINCATQTEDELYVDATGVEIDDDLVGLKQGSGNDNKGKGNRSLDDQMDSFANVL